MPVVDRGDLGGMLRAGILVLVFALIGCTSEELIRKRVKVAVVKPPVQRVEVPHEENLRKEQEVASQLTPMDLVEGGLKEAAQIEVEEPEEAPLEMGPELDIPIVVNDRVEYFIRFFQTTARKRFTRWLKRSGKYIPLMKKLLREHGLPEDLVYMAMIESGFNPKARSHRRAVGPWQFIHRTGKKYGLRVDYWVDERQDPERSTVAAARYLKDLYDQFRCWYLAAAGYNAGEGRIARAIRRYRTEDFWELSKYRYLRRETRDYVPKMIAAALIAKNPEKYGFGGIEYDEPMEFDRVTVPPATDLGVVAKCCGISYREIKALNPALLRWCTPPDGPYEIRIPKGRKEQFLKCFNDLPDSKRRYSGFVKYRLRRGDTLWRIAKRYGIGLRELMRINRIKNPRRLRAGQYILVPRKVVLSKASRSTRVLQDRGKKVVYIVRRGDTLWRIAKRYAVSVRDLKRWNNLRGDLIRPKDRLLLWLN